MPQIARDQVVGAGRIGTFQEPIVIGIARHFKTPRRYDQVTSVFDELEQLPPQTLANSEFQTEKEIGILIQDRLGHVKTSGLRYRQKEGRALQALGLSAAEITTLVSITSRSGSITASISRSWMP